MTQKVWCVFFKGKKIGRTWTLYTNGCTQMGDEWTIPTHSMDW